MLAAVVFKDEGEANRCSDAMDALRLELGWKPEKEFKFNNMQSSIRIQVLERLGAFAFTTHIFALNKPQLWPRALQKKNQMYAKIVRWIIENAVHDLEAASIVFDKCGGPAFYKILSHEIDAAIRSRSKPNAIQRITSMDSKHHNLLQVADIVCGSAARLYSRKCDAKRYYPLISHKQGTFRFWPPE